ncbi:MAG: ribonuclease E/G [Pseudomonadota bacterium]|nr:ribonuclease E/G [Pseudomonadota bacterium]
MTRRMLIDAAHEEETRVVVMDRNRVVDYDAEIANKRPLKGNIYLAKVTRVEPSLQAAFVEYGGNRHGFLAFNEIHPDYYRIPIADREALIAEEAAEQSGEEGENGDIVETVGGDELEDVERRRLSMQRRYKIQEVIKRRQILLVQVVKEERGTKGAALTTYLSLAGRYCVLMPNTSRGGGISRKITNPRDRKRLKIIIDGLGIPDGMAVILRTAGSERSKAEIKRDYDYLLRLWSEIRELTLASTAPALIYEEGNLIKRTIRDLYSKEVEEILVAGESGYKIAKDFMKTLIPSHAKKVKKFASDSVPLFQEFRAESLLESIHNPTVQLRSGGYIVIHQTEALVAIDVNSGRATRERHIEETALKTNCEAAEEIAYQLKLRDLAGLIVIDFIDMEENRNNITVERRYKDALRSDRARIQIGRISPFGLLEMSRQRLRPSLIEITGDPCLQCGGTGFMQSTDWTAVQVLRAVEESASRKRATEIDVSVSDEVALYLLNQKRQALSDVEKRNDLRVTIKTNGESRGGIWEIEVNQKNQSTSPKREKEIPGDDRDEDGDRRRRRGRRRKPQQDDTEIATSQMETSAEASDDKNEESREDDERGRRRRRRGRRGGRRRNRSMEEHASTTTDANDGADNDGDATSATVTENQQNEKEDPPATIETGDQQNANQKLYSATAATNVTAREDVIEPDTELKRKRRRRRTKTGIAEANANETVQLEEPTPLGTNEIARDDEKNSPAENSVAKETAETETVTANPIIDKASNTVVTTVEDTSLEERLNEDTPTATRVEPAAPPRRGWWQRSTN